MFELYKNYSIKKESPFDRNGWKYLKVIKKWGYSQNQSVYFVEIRSRKNSKKYLFDILSEDLILECI